MSDDFTFDFTTPRGRRTDPAKRTATPRKRTPKKTLRTPAEIEEAFTKQLNDLAAFLNTVSKASRNPTIGRDAAIVKVGTENFAKSWGELSEQDKRVHAACDAFISSAAWTTALGATAAIIVPILINHGLLPNWFRSDADRPPAPVVPINADAETAPEDAGHVDAV